MSLKSVLAGAIGTQADLGGVLSGPTIKALRRFRRQASAVSLIVLLFVLVAVGITFLAAINYAGKPDQLKLVVGATGLSVAGALVVLRGSWKDWSQANLLLIFIEEAREDQVRSLIDTLIKKL